MVYFFRCEVYYYYISGRCSCLFFCEAFGTFAKEIRQRGYVMKNRYKLNGKKSRKMFTRTADRTHSFNLVQVNPMRGGIRM